jgi:ankyrin repeat protein
VNTPDDQGNTPLHIATKLGNIEAAETLLQFGAEFLATNHKGEASRVDL